MSAKSWQKGRGGVPGSALTGITIKNVTAKPIPIEINALIIFTGFSPMNRANVASPGEPGA
ncbi:MAG TPA: hypothetical protein DIV41_08960 [Ruminococcaceae bacterium]|nr:hypothetical protein [Oscillospiraceae bacterium]